MNKAHTWSGERLEPGVFNETTIEHLHRYALAMEYIAHKKVLDLACGEGYGSALMTSKALHVTGIDIDDATIAMASQKYKQGNLSFIKGTTVNIPAPAGEFDVVISFETLEHVGEHEKMLAEITRVLKPGGLLIISTPDKSNYTDKPNRVNPFHVKELTKDDFAALLKGHFVNYRMLQQDIAFSSVITGDEAQDLDIYNGNFNEIKKAANGNHLYNIAFASDSPLPPVKNSLFNGRSVFAEAVTEKENQVIGSLTYKAGHLLLYPAKLIRRMFGKENRSGRAPQKPST